MIDVTFTTPTGKRAKSTSEDRKLVIDPATAGLPLHDGKHPFLPVKLADGREARLALGRCNLYLPDGGRVTGATVQLGAGTVTIAESAPEAAPVAGATATGGDDAIWATVVATGDATAIAAYLRGARGMDATTARAVAKKLVS